MAANAGSLAAGPSPPDAHCHQRLSVAPMMDWTDVHYRQLARLISRRTWLWTEMVVDKTILHSPQPDRFLWFPPEQSPLVLQLGGSDPATLAAAALKAAPYGYDEINLNCGCPSDRVAGAGCFGASLMLTPALVADCMAAVRAALDGGGYPSLPVSVKCRLGVDDADSYEALREFVRVVSEAGRVRHFVVHARKCLLNGLSPAQNRSVPPLRHEWVWGLKRDFPHLHFSLNGGLQNAHEAAGALALDAAGLGPGAVSGVMIGRAAYNDPWGVLADADVAVWGEAANPAASRRAVLEAYCDYCDDMLGRWGVKDDGHREPNARALLKPALNLFHGEHGSKRWKAAMDAALRAAPKDATVRDLLAATLHALPESVLDAPPLPARVVAAVAKAGGNARLVVGGGAPAGAAAAADGSADEAAAAAGEPAGEPAAAGVAAAVDGGAAGSGAAGSGAAEEASAAAAAGEPAAPAAAKAGPPDWRIPPEFEPEPYSLPRPLPQPEDRAAGDEPLRRKRQKKDKKERQPAAAAAAPAAGGAAAGGDGGANGGGGGGGSVDEERQDQRAAEAAAQQAVAA